MRYFKFTMPQQCRYLMEPALESVLGRGCAVSEGYGDSSSTTWVVMAEATKDWTAARLEASLRLQFSGWLLVEEKGGMR